MNKTGRQKEPLFVNDLTSRRIYAQTRARGAPVYDRLFAPGRNKSRGGDAGLYQLLSHSQRTRPHTGDGGVPLCTLSTPVLGGGVAQDAGGRGHASRLASLLDSC